MTFEEVKKDYLELMGIGIPQDMTGGFVAEEHMERVIRNPTKSNAKRYMLDVINYGFQAGTYWNTEVNGEIHIEDNEIVNAMYEKYIAY